MKYLLAVLISLSLLSGAVIADPGHDDKPKPEKPDKPPKPDKPKPPAPDPRDAPAPPQDGKDGATGPAGAKGDKGEPGRDGKDADGQLIKTNQTSITSLTSKHDADYSESIDRAYKNTRLINQWDDRYDDGLAMSAALGGLPQAYRLDTTQVAVGFGAYDGNTAVAIGLSRRASESVVFKFGVAVPTDDMDEGVYSGSVGYEF
jgi:hypothetical protein